MQYHNTVMNGMMISFHYKTVKCTNHLFSGTVLHTVLWLNGCMCSIVLLSIFRYGLTTAQLGVEYYSNKKGWMTTAVFNTWITNWNHNLRWMQGNHKVVLFVDQASSHVLQDLSNIRIQFLPPNMTSKLQPMDQGVIRSLKCHYRSRLTERYLAGITEGQTTQQLAKKIDLKVAMDMLTASWNSIPSALIENCFCHAGFIPGPVQSVPEPGTV